MNADKWYEQYLLAEYEKRQQQYLKRHGKETNA